MQQPQVNHQTPYAAPLTQQVVKAEEEEQKDESPKRIKLGETEEEVKQK